jgi:hypothetical protein
MACPRTGPGGSKRDHTQDVAVPRGDSVSITIRDLPVGHTFKLFTRYRDGVRRPRLKYGAEGVRLRRAYLRLRGHAIGPAVVEITRMPFDFSDELTVVEHLRGGTTMVRDTEYRLAPVWSGLVLQNRTAQSGAQKRRRA